MIVSGWARYPAGVLWAFRDAGWKVAGLDLVVDSDIPLGAGLASSAALTCAVAIACRDLFEFELPPRALAALAQRAESEFAGAPVGILDPMASLLCEPECALLLDARTLAVEQVPLGLAEVGLTLLVIDTREPHRLDDSAYADRRGACEAAARALHLRSLRDLNPGELDEAMKRLGDPVLARRVRHVVSENARVMEAASFLRAGDAEGIGALLSASHDSLRDDFEVSSAALDAAVAGAARGGAHGARLSGAGFGGSALALVAIDRVASVVIAVAEEFQAQGLAEPHVFEVAPAGGARRLT
jgi:galactokinase